MYPYQDSALSPEARTKDLLARMTLEEKIGQLNEIPLSRHNLPEIEQEIRAGRVGSLIYATSALAGDEEQFCGGWDDRQRCQRIAVEETRLGLPMINGSNIVHGHRTAGPSPRAVCRSHCPATAGRFRCTTTTRATAARSTSITATARWRLPSGCATPAPGPATRWCSAMCRIRLPRSLCRCASSKASASCFCSRARSGLLPSG